MSIDDFRWAINKVLYDWRKRKPKQVRNSLPPSHTSSTLRYIRINACKQAAPDTIECAKWSQTDPSPPGYSSSLLSIEEREGPFLLTGDYVCDQCKHPQVNNELLISKLGLTDANQNFSVRTLQRYMNAQEQMPVDQFRRAVANALAHGWLGLWQVVSIWMQTDQLVAARNGLLAVFRRSSERKAFIERQEHDVSMEEIERELVKQMRILDNEATRSVDQILKNKNLDPEVRRMLEEARFADKPSD